MSTTDLPASKHVLRVIKKLDWDFQGRLEHHPGSRRVEAVVEGRTAALREAQGRDPGAVRAASRPGVAAIGVARS
eukprot:11205888-Lingulodinium_polyedra.AAC.1